MSDVQLKLQIENTTDKIVSYKALLSTTRGINEQLQGKIYQMSMEIASGLYDINNGTQVFESTSNEYIKKSILEGLKKRALAMIEDEVILELLISEREKKLGRLQQQLLLIESTKDNSE